MVANFPSRLSDHGIYENFFWGHIQVAQENKTTLPSAGLFIIRYHSFYGKL